MSVVGQLHFMSIAKPKSIQEIRDIYRNTDLKRRYGITLRDYQRMLENQSGSCALCFRKPKRRKLHVDHCHRTGRIRGLLCSRCNQALGALGDTAVDVLRAVKYLLG